MIKQRLPIIMAQHKDGPLRSRHLAQRAGLSENTISAIYNGKITRMEMETLNKLCVALDCQPGDLLEYVPDAETR